VYSDSALPHPERIRFYHPDLDGYRSYLSYLLDVLALHAPVINVHIVLNPTVWEMYGINFLRAYMMLCHKTVYQSVLFTDQHIGSLTPKKIEHLLRQPVLDLLVQAVRELCRPMVSADGFIWYPLYTKIIYESTTEVKDILLRNFRPLGPFDNYLATQWSLYYHPNLAFCISHYYSGLSYITGIGVEGLEPTFLTMLAKFPSSKISADKTEAIQLSTKVDVKKGGDMTPGPLLSLEKFAEDTEIDVFSFSGFDPKVKEFFDSSIVISDLSVFDDRQSKRDAAFRLLAHFRIYLPCNPYSLTKYSRDSLHKWWPGIQIFGYEMLTRTSFDMCFDQWQLSVVLPCKRGVRDWYGIPFYQNRFLSPAQLNLKLLVFPTLGIIKKGARFGTGPKRNKRTVTSNSGGTIQNKQTPYPSNIKGGKAKD
jgi:hypothetical protein